jgi:enterochelin esterase family protein
MSNLPAVLLLSVATTTSAQVLVSPEVHPDGRVTFRLRAPNAKEVVLRCEGTKGGPMQKGENGVWSITTEPLKPDIYAYSFQVDGLHTIDPANPLLKYNLLNTDSQVHVPGAATLPWEINNVPHGVLHRHLYHSAILGDERPFVVYTPPGYDPAAKVPYPVLYLLHGYSDAEDAWISVGRANIILDNLIAQSRAKPMLIVMPLGYGNKEVIANGWAGLSKGNAWQDSVEKFRDVLLNEILPQVEKTYRVSPERKARAIAGLSMGGTQSLFIGLNALDRFGWIGAFSSGGLDANFEKAYPSVSASTKLWLHLLWIACGEQDGLIGLNRKLVDWLKSKGVELTWAPTPGTHSFTVWRCYLAQFAPLLFREEPRADRLKDRSVDRAGSESSQSDDERLKTFTSSYVARMGELPLSSGKEPSDLACRFLWLRTFHHPVSVRIQRSGSSIILRGVELDGAGGYAPGKIAKEVKRELSPAEWETVVAKLDRSGFWQMESREDRSRMGLDGATWILEGSQGGKYHVVSRWSPESGDFREACLFFLQLSNLMIPGDEIY